MVLRAGDSVACPWLIRTQKEGGQTETELRCTFPAGLEDDVQGNMLLAAGSIGRILAAA